MPAPIIKVQLPSADVKRGASQIEKELRRVGEARKRLDAAFQKPLTLGAVAAQQRLTQSVRQSAQATGAAERAYRQLQSSLGGAERASAQTAQAQMRLAAAQKAGLVAGGRVVQLQGLIGQRFSTTTVKSRDLRDNFVRLNSSLSRMGALSVVLPGQLGLIGSQMSAVGVATAGLSLKMKGLIGVGVGLGLGFGALTKGAVQVQIEMDKINRFFEIATGTTAGARRELEFVREEATRLGLRFLDTAESYGRFAIAAKAAGVSQEETRKIFSATGGALSVLNASGQETRLTFKALEQMFSRGRVSMQEVNQLAQQIPTAFTDARKALGVTNEELVKLIESGKLLPIDLIIRFADVWVERYGGQVAAAAADVTSQFNLLRNEIDLLYEEFGKTGAIDLAKKGITGLTSLTRSFNETLALTNQFLDDFKSKLPDLSDSKILRFLFPDIAIQEAIEKFREFQAERDAIIAEGGATGAAAGFLPSRTKPFVPPEEDAKKKKKAPSLETERLLPRPVIRAVPEGLAGTGSFLTVDEQIFNAPAITAAEEAMKKLNEAREQAIQQGGQLAERFRMEREAMALPERERFIQQQLQSVDLSSLEAQARARVADAIRDEAGALFDLQRQQQITNAARQEFHAAAGFAFGELIRGSRDFEGILENIGNRLADLAVELLIIRPLMTSLFGAAGTTGGGLLGGLIGSLSLAEHGLVAHGLPANTLVTQPTFFPDRHTVGVRRFAHGGTLAGERGTEAIMPLVTTRSGDLGVRAEGDGIEMIQNVTVVNNHPTAEVRTRTRDRGPGRQEIEIFIDEQVANVIERGGKTSNAIGRQFGLNRVPGGR